MGIWQRSILFYIGGLGYCGLELLWRGRTHPSMFLLGGLCFLLLGALGARTQDIPLPLLALAGSALITALELVTGLLCNLMLGLQVWDYSGLPCNFLGQICLPFSLLWVPLSALGILANALLRRLLFGTPFTAPRLLPLRLSHRRATGR